MSKWFVLLMETSGHYPNYQITVTLVGINNVSVYQYQYQYQFMDNSTKSYIVQPLLIIRKGCLIKINPINPLPYTLEVDTSMACMLLELKVSSKSYSFYLHNYDITLELQIGGLLDSKVDWS